ncbi:MAG: AarF/ABC1/UbiB kinase family protein [Myxococcales bacterium]|nr:AarF/ABC1/UbiB kinase family protein [Myxococcales bacterium]
MGNLSGEQPRREPEARPSSLPPPRRSVSPPPPSVRPARKGLATRPPPSASWRFVRAYSTTFIVLASYLWLGLKTRFFGRAYREQKITAVHQKNARRVEATILELQGLFIKVGQLLSILSNFLPPEFRSELEGLQDQVPPRPFAEIKRRIESELDKPLASLFAHIHEEPIASASLGQVHEATLPDGRRVVVKVQHADIDRIVRLDLVTIRRILTIVQWFVPIQGLDSYYKEVKELLKQELDFEREAQSIERIAKNFVTDPRVVFPTPVGALSTKRVLTTTFVEGSKVVDVARLDELGLDKSELATRLVRLYCQMIFVDGVYHADPHPGNILVRSDGAIVLLDFGAVAELSTDMREGIPEFLEGVLRRDTDRLIRALRKMGFLSRASDEVMAERVIEHFHRRFQEEVRLESLNLKDIKIDPQRGFENLLDLRRMNVGLRELSDAFHVPKDWVLLERTLLLLYGCCATLDPHLNPMAIIQPYLQDFVLGNRDFTQLAVETVREMALKAITLPDDLRKYLTRATRGEMEVRVRGLSEGAHTVYAAARQIIYTAIGIAAGMAALQLHFHGEPRFARYAAYVAGGAFALLLLSSLFSRPRSRR